MQDRLNSLTDSYEAKVSRLTLQFVGPSFGFGLAEYLDYNQAMKYHNLIRRNALRAKIIRGCCENFDLY